MDARHDSTFKRKTKFPSLAFCHPVFAYLCKQGGVLPVTGESMYFLCFESHFKDQLWDVLEKTQRTAAGVRWPLHSSLAFSSGVTLWDMTHHNHTPVTYRMLMLRTSPECRDEDTTVLNNLLF
jgi:hypothetical protein